VAGFDRGFLDTHPKVASQLSRDPGLADNSQFLAAHTGLAGYLAHHPRVRADLRHHPERFMAAESHYERYENERSANGNCLPATRPIGNIDNGYLDTHPEVAYELSRDPGLVDNPQFLASHPGLADYLAHHPRIRAEFQRHPAGFMQAESRYERYEGGANANVRQLIPKY
jgi:hypothetical protein